jgi:hypothetical protein
LGHEAVGLDGVAAICCHGALASGCEVLHLDFLAIDLPERRTHSLCQIASPAKIAFFKMPWMPQSPSTTRVTPKSTPDRHQRDRFILGQSLCRHQQVAYLGNASRIAPSSDDW